MKAGMSLKIDVTKIDKSRIFNANSGAKYVDLTVFVDTENPSKYGDHGMIKHSTTKEERENGVEMAILGNAKVFWHEDGWEQPEPDPAQGVKDKFPGSQTVPNPVPDDDIPF